MKKRKIKINVVTELVPVTVSRNLYDALKADYAGVRKLYDAAHRELIRRREENEVLLRLLKERTP